jgi:uncharacterized protein (TIGR02300 family)
MRARRGTKRVCQACQARFYDLAREPIVCPLCGTHYVPDAPPPTEARAGPFTDKTGWRRKAFRRPDPHGEAGGDVPANDNATEDNTTEEAEEVVLDEQEPDEADVSTYVDHRDAEPNDR